MMPLTTQVSLALVLSVGMFGCSSADSNGDETSSDIQAATADGSADAAAADGVTTDTTDDTAVELDTSLGPDVSDTVLMDSDDPDTAPDEDTAISGSKTLADYIPCDSNNDCPSSVGGTCVVELPLLHAAPDGAQTVSLSELSGGAVTGLCLLTCTDNVDGCDGLSIVDSQDDPIAYTCQLVYAAPSPYPSAEALPFVVDETAMAIGTAFAAVCRPPFQLAPAVGDSFCRTCLEAGECQGGACWDASTGEAPAVGESGVCLVPCEAAGDCMFGFTCMALDGANDDGSEATFCVPFEATCGTCRDLDGDGRGVGYCGSASDPVSEVDCDDNNATAYHDGAEPFHPFKDGANCGVHDYNCNGASDDIEVIGAVGYAQYHCSFCGDACDGDVPDGVKTCLGEPGSAACGLVCATGLGGQVTHAHCDNDLDNGCETAVNDPANVYFPDTDKDGAGDDDVAGTFDCGGGLPAQDGPWVTNQADCDDDSSATYGAVPDGKPSAPDTSCDGVDNDCDGVVDDDYPTTTACETDLTGACADGFLSCSDGEETCVPIVLQGEQVETCDVLGVDEDCDGIADAEESGGLGGIDGVGAPCSVPGKLGICAENNTTACVANLGIECVAPEPALEDAIADGLDTDCDGFDGVKGNYRFVTEIPKTVLGVATVGKAQLQSSIDTCAADSGCSGVVMSNEGTWVIAQAIVLRSGVSLYGGWDPATGTFPDNESTKLLRSDVVDDANRLIGVRGVHINKPTTLARLTVQVSDANGTIGTDVYGLNCHQCSGLSIGYAPASGPAGAVTIIAGQGSLGAVGVQTLFAPLPGGYSGGLSGTGGPGSGGATAGTQSATGLKGGTGSPGASGLLGHGGGPPQLSCDGFLTTQGGINGTAGESGGGGGGGGNANCACTASTFCSESWTLPGGGGAAGASANAAFGTGGGAGGSSVGLTLTASSGAKFLGAVLLTAGEARLGGSGGPGVKAEQGTAGGPGTKCVLALCPGSCKPFPNVTVRWSIDGIDGGQGGTGGAGGSSGPGGGGAHGSSIAFLSDELTGTLAGSGSIVQAAGGLAENNGLGNCGLPDAGQTTPATCTPETVGHPGILGNTINPAVLPSVLSCVP
ncbi:MAG: hypothetical protein ACI9OJ_000385 [Myxococcota bacterium]|jgi:hypothetical protein